MEASNTAFIMTYQDGIPNGTDVYLGSGSRTALNDYRNNATFAQAMREASHRILYVISNYSAAVNGMTPDTPVGETSWWWSNALIAAMSAFGVLAAGSIGMYIVCLVKDKKQK